MKRLLLLVLILPSIAFAQGSYNGKSATLSDYLRLRNYNVIGISNDTLFSNKRTNYLVTEWALKNFVASYVATHSSGGGGGPETDPVWTAEKTDYLTAAIAATTYSPASHTHTFSSLTSKPTSLAGYGITDAYPLTGNPSGFLTSFTESDPVYSASSWPGTTNNSSNWNTAFSWGNHSTAGYLTTAIAASAYSPISHSHVQSDVTNLVTDLSAKAPLSQPSFTGWTRLANATTSQMNAIASPQLGMVVYNTDNNSLYSYDGSNWRLESGKKSDFMLAHNAIGSPIIAEPIYGLVSMPNTSTTMANARVYLMACYLDRTTLASGVIWHQNIQGVYTAGGYNGVGLYSYNTTTGVLTLVANSADDGNIWKATASTWSQKPFSSAVILAPGLYFIGALFTSGAITTSPAINSITATAQSSSLLPTNSARLFGYFSSGTFPSTQAISGVTGGFALTLALY